MLINWQRIAVTEYIIIALLFFGNMTDEKDDIVTRIMALIFGIIWPLTYALSTLAGLLNIKHSLNRKGR